MLIYKPARQFMTPNNVPIEPAVDNEFSLSIDGQICKAYRFTAYDLENKLVEAASSGRVDLPEPLYDGDILRHTVAADVFTAGSTYKWQMDLYANDLDCTLDGNTIKCANHNFVTGDTVFVSAIAPDPAEGEEAVSASLPEPLKENTLYYVRKLDSGTFALYEYLEGSKNDAGRIEITGTLVGDLVVSNVVTSEQVAFGAYNLPTITFDSQTIPQQSWVFAPEYSHPQNVMINNWTATVRTDNSDDYDTSGAVYRSKMEYEYDGLMSGMTYYVRFDIETNVGQKVTTGYVPFVVDYATPEIDIVPTAQNDEYNAAMIVNWGGLVNIVGEVSGTHSYINPFAFTGNKGLLLGPGSTLTFRNLRIEEGSLPPRFWWSPESNDFSEGIIIMRATNTSTGDVLEVGYNGTNFYRRINNVVINNAAMPISSNLVYLIGFEGDNLVTLVVGEKAVASDEEGAMIL